MQLFPRPLEIGDEEGFTPEKDIFGRAAFGAGLADLLSSASDPIVIALDGQWGSGKTTFLKMWAGELRKQGFPVIYFDAFENDYTDDAFLAIAGEIIALTEERKKENTTAGKRLKENAVTAGKVLLRSSLKLGVKAATVGVLAAADLDNIAKDFASEASLLVDEHLGEMLTKQKQQRNAIQGFRNALSELPGLLSGDLKEGESPKPLIFIIDELDRCRPSFALETLERIKHFFSVPNVHFVLGVHRAQLQNSVVVAYGSNIDANTYLQKFIQVNVPLSTKPWHWHDRPAVKYLAYLERAMGPVDTDTTELTLHVAEHRNLSLRALERIYTTLVIAKNFGLPRHPSPILDGLCILKVIDPMLYLKAKEDRLRYPEVRDALCLERQWAQHSRHVDWIVGWWKFSTDETLEASELEALASGLGATTRDRLERPTRAVNEAVDRLAPRS